MIEVPDELWNEYKKVMTKDKTVNDHIVELIRKEVEKHGKEN